MTFLFLVYVCMLIREERIFNEEQTDSEQNIQVQKKETMSDWSILFEINISIIIMLTHNQA